LTPVGVEGPLRSWLASFTSSNDDPANPVPRSLIMNDEAEPQRLTIHVFEIDLETGDVPVREPRVIGVPTPRSDWVSILSLDLGPALKKLEGALSKEGSTATPRN
jgi:hypothetical protein